MRISKWYLLAGGTADRWGGYGGVSNKCELPIDGETLLDRTSRLFRSHGIEDVEIVRNGYDSKRRAFEGISAKAGQPFGILLGDCYYSEAIVRDAVNRDVSSWTHYYNCLPNPWTGCPWEEGYIHLVPDWEWWNARMSEFNGLVDSGAIEFFKDFQIDRYLRGYSPDECRKATLDEHDVFWSDETDDFDLPRDYDMFMARHADNKAGKRPNRVSVLIPHYNMVDRLVKLLDSLAPQVKAYPETEVVVVDDGSTCDISRLRSYDKFPVKRIYQPNRGVADARNVLLMASTGEYVVFMDADDQVEPNYLHVVYTTMRGTGCDYAIYPFYSVATRSVAPFRANEIVGNYGLWAYSFRWGCIGRERFDPSLNVHDDEDWLKRVVTEGKRRFESSQAIYRYDWNANPDSLSKRFNRGDMPLRRQ